MVWKLHSVVEKMSGSGRKVVLVPVFGLLPISLRGASAMPFLGDLDDHPGGKSVSGGGTDAMETAGFGVCLGVKLATGVQSGHGQLNTGEVVFGIKVGGDAPALIFNRQRAIFINGDENLTAEANQSFINAVVDNFFKEVVEAFFVGGTNVHARAFAHRLEALKNLNVFGGVFCVGLWHFGTKNLSFLGHLSLLRHLS